MKAFIVIAALILLVGCRTKQLVLPAKTVTNTIEKIVTKTVRDTTLVVKADSSFYQAWIECVNNKPVLLAPTTNGGSGVLKPPSVSLEEDGLLNVECATENLELKARINDLMTELKTTSGTIEYIPVEVINPLTFLQTLLITMGKIFGVILLLTIGYGAIKLVTKYYVRK